MPSTINLFHDETRRVFRIVLTIKHLTPVENHRLPAIVHRGGHPRSAFQYRLSASRGLYEIINLLMGRLVAAPRAA